MSDLATVDLPGVEILAADVTIHGRGSPPGGDRYSVGELRAIAEAHRELASELRPPAKIGHDGYGPSVGWLENLRVIGSKLVADVKDVPRRFAELIDSRAFDGRSVELSRITSQRTGRKYPLVVSALAWLDDRLPAVRTLDDVHALYEGDVELVRAYELDAPADAETLIEQARGRAHRPRIRRDVEALVRGSAGARARHARERAAGPAPPNGEQTRGRSSALVGRGGRGLPDPLRVARDRREGRDLGANA